MIVLTTRTTKVLGFEIYRSALLLPLHLKIINWFIAEVYFLLLASKRNEVDRELKVFVINLSPR